MKYAVESSENQRAAIEDLPQKKKDIKAESDREELGEEIEVEGERRRII